MSRLAQPLQTFLHRRSKSAKRESKMKPPSPADSKSSSCSSRGTSERSSSVYSQSTWEAPAEWSLPSSDETKAKMKSPFDSTPGHDEQTRTFDSLFSPASLKAREFSLIIPELAGDADQELAPTEQTKAERMREFVLTGLLGAQDTPLDLLRTAPEISTSAPDLSTSLASNGLQVPPRPSARRSFISHYAASDHSSSSKETQPSEQDDKESRQYTFVSEGEQDDSEADEPDLKTTAVAASDAASRGRSLQRNLPSYYHREQNYARRCQEAAAFAPGHGYLHDGDEEGPASDHEYYTPDTATSKMAAEELVRSGQARTISAAYHQLLVNEYQGLTSEFSPWDSPSDRAASNDGSDDEEERRDSLEPLPEPMGQENDALVNLTDILVADPEGRSSVELETSKPSTLSSTKTRGSRSSLNAILPSSSKRKGSAASGDVFLSTPWDLKEDGLTLPPTKPSSPAPKKHFWQKRSSSTIPVGPVCALPLEHPAFVPSSPRLSIDAGSAPSHLADVTGNLAPTSTPFPSALVSESDTARRPSHDSSTSSKSSWSVLKKVANAAHSHRRASAHAAYEPLADDGEGTAGTGGGGSTKANSMLARAATRRASMLAGTASSTPGAGSAGDAKAAARKKEDLKKAIRLVGSVDPREVETAEDTTRRLIFGRGEDGTRAAAAQA